MSQKKYIGSVVSSIREEQLLFELCSSMGMSNGDAFRRGVLWSAEALITTGKLPENLIADYNALRKGDTDYLISCQIAHLQHRNVAHEFVNSPHVELSAAQEFRKFDSVIAAFSKEEITEFSNISASVRDYEVAALIPRIRNLYEIRTGTPAPFWSNEDELSILNELIDLAGA